MYREFVDRAARYYTEKLLAHGSTPEGVDWNSAESQRLRFQQFLRVLDVSGQSSLLDYGCGYGALLGYLREQGYQANYQGFDASPQMAAAARELFGRCDGVRFLSDPAGLLEADFAVASGVFNVKLDADPAVWTAYVLDTLHELDRLSIRGFAFNLLTSYSDPDRMRSDLYYGSPTYFFDYCKRTFSKQVALLHDYGLYEFTVGVRKQPGGTGTKG